MAQPTAIYDTYDASGPTGAPGSGVGQGLRESLADKIYNISPTETPFVSLMRKSKAKAVFEEWQTDTLATATTANAALDGDDPTLAEPGSTVRIGNRCQIMTKAFGVTGTVEVVSKAGRSSELAYQLAKRSAEIKRDLESVVLNNQAAVTGSATVARKMAGFPAWIITNTVGAGASPNSRGTGGADGVIAGGTIGTAATDGTQRAFDQAMLDAQIQTTWLSGGKPTVLLAGAKQRSVFSGFDGISNQQNVDVSGRKIWGVADVYMSNFGEIRVVADRFIRQTAGVDREVFGVDPEHVELAELRPFFVKNLAVSGDSEKRLLIWEGTLKVLNEAAHFVCADLS